MDYIAEHRGEFGVEPICRVLTEHGCPIAPSTFYQAVSRRPSRRQLRDEQLTAVIAAERAGSRHVAGLGARKMWLRLRSQGHDVARCTVERLMGQMGVTGLTRGARPPRTTRPDPAAARPADLVDRHFAAVRPNQLWVADFTYCPTWAGMVYVAFVFDVFSRRILGWRAATAMTTPLVLDCLEQAIWTRRSEGTRDLSGLVHHTDAGSPNIRRSRSPAAWPRQASTPRSARSATPTTTPWPNHRSAYSKPSCSTRTVPGATATTSSQPSLTGSPGSTPNAPTNPSTTSPRSPPSNCTIVTGPASTRPADTKPSLQNHRGGSKIGKTWPTRAEAPPSCTLFPPPERSTRREIHNWVICAR